MSDQFTTYQPPGVYTTEERAVAPVQVGVAPAVVAIVGPSVGYRTNTEAVVLDGSTDFRLTKLGIDIGSIVVIKADGTTAVVDDDYELTQGDGVDGDPDTTDDTMDIVRASGTTIGDGETVVVSYNYTDESYFEPLRVTSNTQVSDAYGAPLDRTSGAILSPLSLAAKFAFDNGAARVVLLATPGTATSVDKDDLSAGYAKLLSETDVTIVVPLPVGIGGTEVAPGDIPAVCTDLVAHITESVADGVRRIAVIGFETSVTREPTTIAADANFSRIVLTHPNRLSYYNSFLQTTVEVSGYYHAAAWAGQLASLPVQYPMTRKQIRGFSGISGSVLATMNKTTKDAWSQGGVAVTEQNAQKGLVCRHGTSTDPTDIFSREISLTRAKDTMVTAIVSNLDGAGLIGSPIVEETAIQLRGQVIGSLETMTAQDVIVGYSGVTVQQVSLDPSVMEVRFQYRPSYPLNYISIVFSIDTTTGNVTDVQQTP